MNMRTTLLTIGATAGALLAATLAPIGTAFADTWLLTPDDSTLIPVQAEGIPPLFEFELGTEGLDVNDTTAVGGDFGSGFVSGNDTHIVFGTFTNDDFVKTSGPNSFVVNEPSGVVTFSTPNGTEVDLANFGGGFENEWISIPHGAITDMLITPFGDFNVPL